MEDSSTFYIITPSFNSELFIDETISSVVAQGNSSLSICYHVQDGGSTDDTIAILKRWEFALRDSDFLRFSYASEQDLGMYDALNKGFNKLRILSGSFMGWINADDLLLPGALLNIAQAALNQRIDWVHGTPSLIDENGKEIERLNPVCFPQKMIEAGLADGRFCQFLQQEGSFFRKRLWDKVGGCNTSYRLAGDWDLWRRMAAEAAPVCLSKRLASFRIRKGQLSADLGKYWAEVDQTIELKIRREKAFQLALSPSTASARLNRSDNSVVFRRGNIKMRTRCLLYALGFKTAISMAQSFLKLLRKRMPVFFSRP